MQITLDILTAIVLALAFAGVGFIARSRQLKSLQKRKLQLENEILHGSAEILKLEKMLNTSAEAPLHPVAQRSALISVALQDS